VDIVRGKYVPDPTLPLITYDSDAVIPKSVYEVFAVLLEFKNAKADVVPAPFGIAFKPVLPFVVLV
jgi:hypothetical protein